MSQKTTALIISSLIIFATIIFLGARSISPEDSWICVDNEWIKHGRPDSPKPTSGCFYDKNAVGKDSDGKQVEKAEFSKEDEGINIFNLQPESKISSPYKFEGEARGTWFFEGSFTVKIIDNRGIDIGQGIATALGEWMTDDFVPFQGTADFLPGNSTEGFVIFMADNPSGLEDGNREMKIPVIFDKTLKQKVKVFFNNPQLDLRGSCEKTFPVERVIPKTQAVARAALEDLLKGPTELEEKAGYFSSINEGVKILNLTVSNGTARVDFDKTMEEGIGGSCLTAGIQSSVVETLKQFPSVKEVVISVEGQTEGILQP